MKITALLHKIAITYKEGRLKSVVLQRLLPFLKGIRYLYLLPFYRKKVKIHCPNYTNEYRKEDEKLYKRLMTAYKQMKKDQSEMYAEFKPSSAWQKFVDTEYNILSKALADNSLKDFSFFLTNFGAWKKYQGIENATLIRNNNTLWRKMYLKKFIFEKQLKTWKWITNNKKPISELSYPKFGNQLGAEIENTFIGPGSFFNEVYGSLLDEITSDKKRPIIADLGAGYGKLAYFILRKKQNFCFIDFDIPEVLTLASFYLMKTFPKKKVLLYGEDEFNKEALRKYDLIFMPPWEIKKTEEDSIDLFINKNSLGEMTKEAAEANVFYICKASQYFFHMNHEHYRNHYSDGSKSILNEEYPISKKMKLLFRYPDLGHLFYQGWLDYGMDIFLYLYEKRINHSTSPA